MATYRGLMVGPAFIALLTAAEAARAGAQTDRPIAAREPPRAAQASALQDTLERLERQSWEAWQKRDAKFFERFLSDDHVEMGFFGPGGKALVVKSVGSPACVVDSYEVDHFKLTSLDARTAVLTYHAAQSTLCNGNPVPSPVWATSLYVQRGGRWLNALYQQTQDLRKPTT